MSLPDWQNGNLVSVAPILDGWALTYSLPREIVYGLVSQESRFNPNAIGDAGRAHGLTQIWYPTAKGMGYNGDENGLNDPNESAKWGLLYLRKMLDRFGDMNIALSAYNGGFHNGAITNPSYVNGVTSRADYFAQLWGNAPIADADLPPDPLLGTMDNSGGGNPIISAMLLAAGAYLLAQGRT